MSSDKKPEEAAVALIPSGLGMPVKKVVESSHDDSFLPWITLVQGGSDSLKKNQPDGVKLADYVMGGRVILPKDFRAKPLGVKDVMIARSHATCDDPELESFVEGDDVWVRIQAQKSIRDSQARIGTDQLMWLPDQHAFAVFSFVNTYAREMADYATAYAAGHVAIFKSRLVEGKKNSWYVPLIVGVKPDAKLDLPTEAQTKKAIDLFFAPVLAYREQKPAAAAPTSRPR